MANPPLPGKRQLTINLLEKQVDLARQAAEARGVAMGFVLRDVITLGLPLYIAKEAEMFDPATARKLLKIAGVAQADWPEALRK